MRIVLAGVDFSEHCDAVLRCARALTDPGGELVLLHVAQPEPDFVGYGIGPQSVRDSVAIELRSEHRELQRLAASLGDSGVTVTALTVQGEVVARLVEHAQRLGAELIVVASHGRSALTELVGGSTVRGLLRVAPLPVVVVPATGRPSGYDTRDPRGAGAI